MESEEDLEETIDQNIKEHRASVRTMCHELCLKYDEKWSCDGHSMLDDEKKLREKVKQLQEEKKRRLDEYNILSTQEHELCVILKGKQIEIKSTVPTESEMDALRQHIKELGKIKVVGLCCVIR